MSEIIITKEAMEDYGQQGFVKHTYKVGDKSKGICCYCGIVKETTLLIHPNDDKRMAFFCDDCKTIVSYPPFGTPVNK